MSRLIEALRTLLLAAFIVVLIYASGAVVGLFWAGLCSMARC